MSEQQQQWTSDHLVRQEYVQLYADQIREEYRAQAADFRRLADEVRRDALRDPVEGDRWLHQRWMHARQLSRGLRQMARHAELIVAAAKQLEVDHRKVRVELPAARADRAVARARRKQQRLAERQAQKALGGPSGVVGRAVEHTTGTGPAAQDEGQQQTPAQQPATPFSALFKDAR
ncbi:hypothetical protein [Streptomyces sp. NPDC049879]|uniref:hypothetical protein n=1 Tax=Streptomyces sp. NPDC049879 TaxID=3365598 RepID=UPI0037BA40E4